MSLARRICGRLRRMIEPMVIALAAKSGLLSCICYCFFSTAFRREHMSVAYGRARYMRDRGSPRGNQYLLRRNIHRLEKGLLMKPFRDVFALDYIGETVACYRSMFEAACPPEEPESEGELRWARDVLKAYFDAAGSHPAIDAARAGFEAIGPLSSAECNLTPYKRDLDAPPPVDYNNFLALARRRRSVRWYLPKSVPRELIDRAVSAAALSPSGCNRQAFEFRIFDNPELVSRIVSAAGGAAGFGDSIPVIAAIVGKLRAYFSEKDRHMVYIDTGLASMSFAYALETLGLASCCLNWPDEEARHREAESLLGLEPDESIILLISLGYPDPDGLVACSQKKSLDALRRYNLP